VRIRDTLELRLHRGTYSDIFLMLAVRIVSAVGLSASFKCSNHS
jgi:hypothetical protein